MERKSTVQWTCALVVVAMLAGCVQPGDVNPTDLTRYQKSLADREGDARESNEGRGLYRPAPSEYVPTLDVRTVEDANGVEVEAIFLPLEDAILRGLANNLDIQIVSYNPAISRQRMVEAAAAFDYVMFGALDYTRTDQQGATFGKQNSRSAQLGVRKTFITGAQASLSYTLQRLHDEVSFTRYEPTLDLEVTQPLLRNGGMKFNLAQLRIARLSHRADLESFRQTVEETVTQIVAAYWALKQARTDVVIQENLLKETVKTHKEVIIRPEARENVEKMQTWSTVLSRRIELIRARKALGDAQDNRAKLLADPQINLRAEAVIVPVTEPETAELDIDPADQLLTALVHNPALRQAKLAIAAAAINVDVAENQTLPRLDLTLSTSLHGRQRNIHQANENLFRGDYASYGMAIAMEYPIGNRERMAALVRRRLEKSQALSQMQNTADQIAQLIQERIRQIESAYDRYLEHEQEVETLRELVKGFEALVTKKARTPQNLQLLLDAQGRLGVALRSRIAAQIDFNNALMDLYRATGTTLESQRIKINLPTATGDEAWPEFELPDPQKAFTPSDENTKISTE